MWTKYFNFIKLRHGRVIVHIHGEIDLSWDDIPIEICKELFEKGFPYLELTEVGKAEFYWVDTDMEKDYTIDKPTRQKKLKAIYNTV